MNKDFDITAPFEQILQRLNALKKNKEIVSEITEIFEQIKQIENYSNTAINTLQNYYRRYSSQVDTLSGLIDFQAKINNSLSPQEVINQIFSFLKEYTAFDSAFLYLKGSDSNDQFEVIAEDEDKREQFTKFLTGDNIDAINKILVQRDLGLLISDVNENKTVRIAWDLIDAQSIILFPIRVKAKIFGFGLLIRSKRAFWLNHLSFVNLLSGFISQTVFHYFYFARLKSKLFQQFEMKKEFEQQGYAQYIEKGPLFIFTLDADGVIVHSNIQSQKHVEKDRELVGEKFINLIRKDHSKPLQNILHQLQEGGIKYYQAPVLFEPQVEYMMELYITKMEVQSNFVMTIIFAADVTEDYYKNQQHNRNEILDEISRFSQTVNEYLANLLRQLEPGMNLFRSTLDASEALKRRFNTFETSLQRTSKWVQNFSKYDITETEMRQEANINVIIKEVIEELQSRPSKAIEIKYSLEPGIPKLLTYPSKVRKLLKILYQNSVEAMTSEGSIEISTKLMDVEKDGLLKPNMFFLERGKYIELVFSDDGIGIDSRVLPQVFKPFFSTKIRNDDIGLGLFIAYNIVKDLEGEIFVNSKQKEYTKVFIYIPYKGDLEMQEILPGMAEAIKEKVRTILVVDDEFNIRSMLKEVFEMNGYYVFTAANGKEGLEIYMKHTDQIDLVILDMVMPVMDGKTTFEEIQKIDKDQKIIIISGYAKKEDLREILDKGALAFMSKPFQIESIVENVARYLSSK